MSEQTTRPLIWLVACAFSLVCTAPAQRVVECRFSPTPPVIDGVLDDAIWTNVSPEVFQIPATQATPLTHAEARLCWDDDHLYLAFTGEDAHLQGSHTERDSATYRDDVFETFIQPGAEELGYHNIEISILGTIHDGHVRGIGTAWTCEEMEIGIDLRGTLNDDSDIDEGWSMELAIPFASLMPLGTVDPSPGDEWPFHLARYDWGEHLPEGRELSSTARLTRVNFHYPPDWDVLRFVTGTNQEGH